MIFTPWHSIHDLIHPLLVSPNHSPPKRLRPIPSPCPSWNHHILSHVTYPTRRLTRCPPSSRTAVWLWHDIIFHSVTFFLYHTCVRTSQPVEPNQTIYSTSKLGNISLIKRETYHIEWLVALSSISKQKKGIIKSDRRKYMGNFQRVSFSEERIVPRVYHYYRINWTK